MFPGSKSRALLDQLQTERAIEQLAAEAYRLYLPRVSDAVFARPALLAAAEPAEPDPAAAEETTAVWDAILAGLLLYGIGLIYANTATAGLTVITGLPPEVFLPSTYTRNGVRADQVRAAVENEDPGTALTPGEVPPDFAPAPVLSAYIDYVRAQVPPPVVQDPEPTVEPTTPDSTIVESPVSSSPAEPDLPAPPPAPVPAEPPTTPVESSPSTDRPARAEPTAPDVVVPEPPPPAEPDRLDITDADEYLPASLNERAHAIVADSFDVPEFDVADFAARVAALPEIRDLQQAYLAGVHNRMVGTPDTVFRDIAAAVNDGLAAGEDPDQIAARVQAHLGPNTGDWPGRALTVARTESAGAQNAATLAAAMARHAVIPTPPLDKGWIATMDERTRPGHFAADGQRVEIDAPFLVSGEELWFPADPAGSAENTIRCRCRLGIMAADEPTPTELTRQHDPAAAAAEVARRAADGITRAREDPDGVGVVASAQPGATMATGTDDQETTTMGTYRSFTAVLAVIGTETDDGRMFDADIDLSFRNFPQPLMWQKQSDYGHMASYTVGAIEDAAREGDKVIGSGYLLNSPEAAEALEQIEHGVTGPSVDLGAVEWELRDGDGNPIDWDAYWDDPDMRIVEVVTKGKVMGATLVSIPAFGETSITLGEMVERGEESAASLVASAAVITTPTYDPAMFTRPEGEPGPSRLDDNGRISGWLALWDTCHQGIRDRCVLAPHSLTDYAWFHTAPPVKTTTGESVPVGRLTVGGGHAAEGMGVAPALAHYDDAGTCFALVHVGEDEHGIWYSGVVPPGADPDTVLAGLAAPLSGDWRLTGGNLELIAALAVNTPGFPVTGQPAQRDVALVASGATNDDGQTITLIASLGPCPEPATPAGRVDVAAVVRETLAAVRADERRAAAATAMLRAADARELLARAGRR